MKLPTRPRIRPGYADNPGERPEQPAQNLLDGEVGNAGEAAEPAGESVQQGDQPDEGDQHGRHRSSHAKPGQGAGSRGIEQVDAFHGCADVDVAKVVFRGFHLRHDDLGHHQPAGRRHETGGDQVLQLDAHGRIAAHDRTGNGGEPAGHHGEQFGSRHRGHEGPHQQRRLVQADEYVGGRAQRFRAARAQNPLQQAADQPHDPAHDAEVIEHRDQRREENDDRQHLKGEDESECVRGKFSENEFAAGAAELEQARHAVGQCRKRCLAGWQVKYQGAERGLQGKGAADGTPVDAPSMRGNEPGERGQNKDADEAGHVYLAEEKKAPGSIHSGCSVDSCPMNGMPPERRRQAL